MPTATRPSSFFTPDAYLRLSEYARRYVTSVRGTAPDSDADCLRAWGSIGGFDDLVGKVNTWLLGGYNARADSTRGWVAEQPLPNFLESRLGTITSAPQPLRTARGGSAAPLVVSTAYEAWQLFRMALSFQVDEQNLLDSGETLGVIQAVLTETGASFRRVVLDAIYGLILSNPTLTDGDALFATDRGNLGAAVLSATSIQDAFEAVAGAYRSIASAGAVAASSVYAHENLEPRYLVVPPNLAITAASVVSALVGSGINLEVRVESRLSDHAFLDPRTDVLRAGNNTNWMLTAPADQAPGIVLGTLGGKREPTVRSFELDHGQWGVGFDAKLDIAVAAVSGRPLYFSTGDGV